MLPKNHYLSKKYSDSDMPISCPLKPFQKNTTFPKKYIYPVRNAPFAPLDLKNLTGFTYFSHYA